MRNSGRFSFRNRVFRQYASIFVSILVCLGYNDYGTSATLSHLPPVGMHGQIGGHVPTDHTLDKQKYEPPVLGERPQMNIGGQSWTSDSDTAHHVHINDMSFNQALEIASHYQRHPVNQPLFTLKDPIFIQPTSDSDYYASDETNILIALPVHRLLQLSLNIPPKLQVAIVKIYRERNGLPSYPSNASTTGFVNHLGFTNDEIMHRSISLQLLQSMGIKVPVFYERCIKLISTNTKAMAAHTCRRMSLATLGSASPNASEASALVFMLKHFTGTKLTRFHKLYKSSYKLHVSEKVAFAYDPGDISITDWARYKTVINFEVTSRVERAGGTAHFPYQDIYISQGEDPTSEQANWWFERLIFESLSALHREPAVTACQRLYFHKGITDDEQIGHIAYWLKRDLLLRSVCDAFQRIATDMEVSMRHFFLLPAEEVPAAIQQRYIRLKEAIHHPLTGSWNDVWSCRASFPSLGDAQRYQRNALPDRMEPACYRAVLASLMVHRMKVLGSAALHGNVIGFIDRATYTTLAQADLECNDLCRRNASVQQSAAVAAGAVRNLARYTRADLEKRDNYRKSLGCSAARLVSDRHWALFYNFLPFTMLASSLQHVEAYNVMFQADGVYAKRGKEMMMPETSEGGCVEVSTPEFPQFSICKKDFRDFLSHCVHVNLFGLKGTYKDDKCGLPKFMTTEIMTACHSSSVYVGHAEGIGEGAWPGLAAGLYSATAQIEVGLQHLQEEQTELPYGFLPIMGKSATWTTSTLATFIATAPLQWSTNDLPSQLNYYMGNLTNQVLDPFLRDYHRLEGGFCTDSCWSMGGHVFNANHWTFEYVSEEVSRQKFPSGSADLAETNNFLFAIGQLGDPVASPFDAWMISRLHAETGWRSFTPLYGITHTGFLTSKIISRFHTFVSHCGFPGGKSWITKEQPKWLNTQRSLEGVHGEGYSYWNRDTRTDEEVSKKLRVGYLSEAYKRGTLVMSTLDKLTIYTAEQLNHSNIEVHIVDLMTPELADSPFSFNITGHSEEVDSWGMGNTNIVEDTSVSFEVVCLHQPTDECQMKRDEIRGRDAKIMIQESTYSLNGIDLFFNVYISNWKALTPFGRLHIIPQRYTRAIVNELVSLDLDTLLITDPSMGPQTFRMCFTRFAPVQAVVWNNGMTSAQPRSVMDYYIASRAHMIEPPDRAASRYSEGLWLFNDSITYTPLNLFPSTQTAEELGFPASVTTEGRQIIAFQHNVQKISPSMDAFLCSLLTLEEKVAPLFTFVTVGRWDGWAVLQRRILRECSRFICEGYISIPQTYYIHGYDGVLEQNSREKDYITMDDWRSVAEDLKSCSHRSLGQLDADAFMKLWYHRTYFIPSAPLAQYSRILELATVSVDAFPFGGGLTTIDSLTLLTPVSTIAATIRSGRLSLAYYRLANFPEIEPSTYSIPDYSCCFFSEDDCLGRWSLNEFVDESASTMYPKFGRNGYGVVASSWCEFFENTVRMMRDHSHRQRVVDVLRSYSHNLLMDKDSPVAWEQHLREMYRRSPFRED